MNAETRAKEVADGIATRLISGGWVATVYPMIVKDWQNAIAAAITQAQNDKLEEALAKISGGFWTCKDSPFRHGASEAVWVGMKPDEMIEAVRSLIQKD